MKYKFDCTLDCYRASLVARGNSQTQTYGFDNE